MTATAPIAPSIRDDSGRSRLPDRSGFATTDDGVRIAFDVYGDGRPTIVFLPSFPIIHSRQWKAQVHYLARHFRVVTYDGRGNGRSDRPVESEAYEESRVLGDLEAVMDATDTPRAVLVGLCGDGVWRAIETAVAHPERVLGIVAFAVGVPYITAPHPHRVAYPWDEELETDEGWAKVNRHYWQRDYPGFAEFFFGQCVPEPHSTKAVEDVVGWTLDGSVDAMIAENSLPAQTDLERVEATCRAVPCPMLLVHGTDDRCQPIARARRLAELTGAPLVEVEGAGHMIPGRHPVLANLLIRDFVRSLEGVRP